MKFRIILGVFLVLMGIAVLGDKITNNNFWPLVTTYWPIILVYFGLDNLFSKHHSKFFASFLIAIGVLFLLGNLDIINVRWYNLIFPTILIAIGIRILVPSKCFMKRCFFKNDKSEEIIDNCGILINKKFNFNGSTDDDIIENYNIFSGYDSTITSQSFKGGEVGAIFGGSSIDLRECSLNNNKAKLELYAIFGGVEVIIPTNWKVQVKGTPIFGGIDNKCTYEKSTETENVPTLIIEAFAIFGGVDILNKKNQE